MIPGATCTSCVFFAPPNHARRGDFQTGQCRRHAPVLTTSDDDRPRTVWPMVNERNWCGEHAVLDA